MTTEKNTIIFSFSFKNTPHILNRICKNSHKAIKLYENKQNVNVYMGRKLRLVSLNEEPNKINARKTEARKQTRKQQKQLFLLYFT